MAGLRTESRSSVFSCLVFVWVSTYICLGQENGFFRSVKFQRLETINMIECGGNFSGNLVSIRIAEKTRNKTFLASYRERDQECKTTSTFSSCLVDKDTRLLKVIVLDLAENETREYECNIARLSQTDEPFTAIRSLNVTRTRSGAIMNEFFRSEKIQRLEGIHVIECGSSFGGNLVSIRIAEKTRSKTFLASYRERDQECRTTSTFSSCLVDKDTRLLKVIVLDLAENETREYECNIARLSQTDEPFTASRSLNVTRTRSVMTLPENGIESSTVSNTVTNGRKNNKPDEPSSGGVNMSAFIAVLIIVILLIVVLCGLLLLHYKRKFKNPHCPTDLDIMSIRSVLTEKNDVGYLDKDSYSLSGAYARGMGVRPPVTYSPPPRWTAPEVPGNRLVMHYQRPLPLSDGVQSTFGDDGTLRSNCHAQYQEPWGHLDDEIKHKLPNVRPNARMCHVPGFEANAVQTDAVEETPDAADSDGVN